MTSRRKWTLVPAFFAIAAAATLLSAYSGASSSQGFSPVQPIQFPHPTHVQTLGMNCLYCHYSANKSPDPGLPAVGTCMGCHLVIGGSDSSHKAEIKKVRDSYNNKQPIEWVRIHSVARHVHFPHMRHIKVLGPNACQTCHGDVARMPQVFKVQNINNMGFCITCHVQRGVNRDCTACHY